MLTRYNTAENQGPDVATMQVSQWLKGRATSDGTRLILQPRQPIALHHKCQLIYEWLIEHAVLCPYTDMAFGDAKTLRNTTGAAFIHLTDQPAYASAILLPLLTLLTSRRLLIIGAPGRGKTTLATLMGLLAGHNLQEMRRAIQHGHPQLSQTDLLGSPLPADLVRAQQFHEIRVIWRNWLSLRVKIIDEYNRIPTKTQSTLLSLMAEGYAELYEQIIECSTSAWFLTANDDLGGGTFPVIDALKDRIDLVVRAMPLYTAHLETLTRRLEQEQTPETLIPPALIFSADELKQMDAQIRAIPVPESVLGPLGFFMAALEFCQRASTQLAYQNKDTLHLAGLRVGQVCTEDCPLDKHQALCSQTENGVSTRAYQALIHYAKALAFFRGEPKVQHEDIRQLIPWVLHERLKPNLHSPFFQTPAHFSYQTDKIAWIRYLYDQALMQYYHYQHLHPLTQTLRQQAEQDWHPRTPPLTHQVYQQRLQTLHTHMQHFLQQEFNAAIHQDLIFLNYLYNSYLKQPTDEQ